MGWLRASAWTFYGVTAGVAAYLPTQAAFAQQYVPGSGPESWPAILAPGFLIAAGVGLACKDKRRSSMLWAGAAAGISYTLLFLSLVRNMLTVDTSGWKSFILFVIVAAVPTSLFLAAAQATEYVLRHRKGTARKANSAT